MGMVLGTYLSGLGIYNHKVGYPEKGVWYGPTCTSRFEIQSIPEAATSVSAHLTLPAQPAALSALRFLVDRDFCFPSIGICCELSTFCLPGFGLFWEVLGHDITYSWGPGTYR